MPPRFAAETPPPATTLLALSVPRPAFARVAAVVEAFPEIVHAAAREHALNLWLAIAADTGRQAQLAAEIERAAGVPVHDMPLVEEYRRAPSRLAGTSGGWRAEGLTVWDLPDAQVAEAGRLLAAMEGVDHCYRRQRRQPNWPYNLFASVYGRDRASIEARAAEAAERLGVAKNRFLLLFGTCVLKGGN